MHDFGLAVRELKNYPFDWNGGDKSRPENSENKLDKKKLKMRWEGLSLFSLKDRVRIKKSLFLFFIFTRSG